MSTLFSHGEEKDSGNSLSTEKLDEEYQSYLTRLKIRPVILSCGVSGTLSSHNGVGCFLLFDAPELDPRMQLKTCEVKCVCRCRCCSTAFNSSSSSIFLPANSLTPRGVVISLGWACHKLQDELILHYLFIYIIFGVMQTDGLRIGHKLSSNTHSLATPVRAADE